MPALDDPVAHSARTATLDRLLARSRYVAGSPAAVAERVSALLASGGAQSTGPPLPVRPMSQPRYWRYGLGRPADSEHFTAISPAAARPVVVGRGIPYTADENASIAKLLTRSLSPNATTTSSRAHDHRPARHESAEAPIEIVERKGLGHPGTLADALAERMSVAYSQYCREQFGVVLHHNLNKVYLRGGHCTIGLGTFEMTAPVTLVIGSRVSTTYAGKQIPYRGLFEDTRANTWPRSCRTSITLAGSASSMSPPTGPCSPPGFTRRATKTCPSSSTRPPAPPQP